MLRDSMAKAQPASISNVHLFKRAVSYLKEHDPKLAKIIECYGIITFSPEGEMFQSLVESILGQQLTPAAASAITQRVKAIYPDRAIRPQPLVNTTIKKLRLAGVSQLKISLPPRSRFLSSSWKTTLMH